MGKTKIAVMQPYLFPYIGYFQLIHSVDKFIYLDDVTYIKRGWINRNKILIQNHPAYFTIPCKKISQNKHINETEHDLNDSKRQKLLKKLTLAYKNAPYFHDVIEIFEQVITSDHTKIGELAKLSIGQICSYLGLKTLLIKSSTLYGNNNLYGEDRIIDFCIKEKAHTYINPMGGQKLYNSQVFDRHGINLNFMMPESLPYKQFNNDFVPWLSILDVLMFNDPHTVRATLLKAYKLV